MSADLFTPAEPRPNNSEDNVRRDRYGRYLLPAVPRPITAAPLKAEQAWTRATTFAKAVSDTTALSKWSARMAAIGVAQSPGIRASVISLAGNPRGNRAELDKLVESAKELAGTADAARHGSTLHSLTHSRDTGDTSAEQYVPDLLPYLDAYSSLLAAAGISVLESERRVAWTRYQVAGTFDRIVTWNGRPHILDIKTGRDLSYGWTEIAVQLCVYAHSDGIWNPDAWRYEPLPPGLSRDTALVIHLPIAEPGEDGADGTPTATLYQVDLRMARDACQLCYDVRAWRKVRNLAHPVPMSDPMRELSRMSVEDRISAASGRDELSAIWREVTSGGGAWTPQLTALGEQRLAELAEH